MPPWGARRLTSRSRDRTLDQRWAGPTVGSAQANGSNGQAVLTRFNAGDTRDWTEMPSSASAGRYGSVNGLARAGNRLYAVGYSNDSGSQQVLLASYDPSAGTPLVWRRDYAPSGQVAYGYAVAVSGGMIYAVGTTVNGSDPSDVVLVSYDAAGTFGKALTWDGPGGKADQASAIAIADGRAYIVGSTVPAEGDIETDMLLLEVDLASFTVVGSQSWGQAGKDAGYGVVVVDRELYVVGETSTNGKDLVILRYSR